jgi:GTPase SAR1 family protein
MGAKNETLPVRFLFRRENSLISFSLIAAFWIPVALIVAAVVGTTVIVVGSYKRPKRILIVGESGSGKSTFYSSVTGKERSRNSAVADSFSIKYEFDIANGKKVKFHMHLKDVIGAEQAPSDWRDDAVRWSDIILIFLNGQKLSEQNVLPDSLRKIAMAISRFDFNANKPRNIFVILTHFDLVKEKDPITTERLLEQHPLIQNEFRGSLGHRIEGVVAINTLDRTHIDKLLELMYESVK